MLEPIKNTSCQLGCWAISGAAAVLTFIMCFGLGEIAFMGAVFFCPADRLRRLGFAVGVGALHTFDPARQRARLSFG